MSAVTARQWVRVTDSRTFTDKDFRDFFLKSPIAQLVVAVGTDGGFAYVEVNPAAAAYFELTREAMLGKSPAELFPEAVAQQVTQALETCVRTKRPLTYDEMPRLPGVIKLQSFILNPILDDDGEVSYVDVMARVDMSNSAQLQRERDDAIMLLTSMFDASGLGIIVTDRHGRIVRVNDAFLADYGWSREELLGEEFVVVIPPEDYAISRKLHAMFIERGKQGTRELQMLKKDGSHVDILLTTALLELSQRRRFMVSTIRDVTERKNMMRNLKRAKEEADSASRAKSSFLANMSHELRTPLNAIIGFSELMKNATFGPISNAKYEEYLTDIHFSARHLLDIINDVLDMSKIEAGKVELMESEVVFTDLFESITRIMSDRADAASVTLAFDSVTPSPHIKADQRLLRQILINLVANSVKFSKPGTSVTVSAALRPDQGIRVVVADQGCGIPSDRIEQVMQPFGQVNDPKYSKPHGTGLGLPLAKAMMELHGGKLALESELDHGTRITLDFPPERTLPIG